MSKLSISIAELVLGPKYWYQGNSNSDLVSTLQNSELVASPYVVAWNSDEVNHDSNGGIKHVSGGLYDPKKVPSGYLTSDLPKQGVEASSKVYSDIFFHSSGSGSAIDRPISCQFMYDFKINNIFWNFYKSTGIIASFCSDFQISNIFTGAAINDTAANGLALSFERCRNFKLVNIRSFVTVSNEGKALDSTIFQDRHSVDLNSCYKVTIDNCDLHQLTTHGLKCKYVTVKNSRLHWVTLGNPEWSGGDDNVSISNSTVFKLDINQNCSNIKISDSNIGKLTVQSEQNKLCKKVSCINGKLRELVFTGPLPGCTSFTLDGTLIDSSYLNQDNPVISINAWGVSNGTVTLKNGVGTGSKWSFIEIHPTSEPVNLIIEDFTYKGNAKFFIVIRTGAKGKVTLRRNNFESTNSGAKLIGEYPNHQVTIVEEI